MSDKITATDATQLVSNFKAGGKTFQSENKKLSDKFSADKRTFLDARLGAAFGVSLALVGMDRVEFGKFCVQQGTPAPKEDENPFSAPVRILFGKSQNGKIVPDKSAWKYGKCFRAAHTMGWTGEDFAEKLKAYELTVKDEDGKEKTLKRLIALETFDSRENGTAEEDKRLWDDIAARLWTSSEQNPPVASFSAQIPGTGTVPDRGFCGAVLQWDQEASVWHVRGIHTLNSDKAWNLIGKQAREDFAAWLAEKRKTEQVEALANAEPQDIDSLLAAMAQQNRDIQKLEFQHELRKAVDEGVTTVAGARAALANDEITYVAATAENDA